jgi:hypothetical protein
MELVLAMITDKLHILALNNKQFTHSKFYLYWIRVKVYSAERHFQQYFSYVVAVSFIGG